MSVIVNQSLQNFIFDIGADPKTLGRLKLPYKAFNFLSILSRNPGTDKYDSSVEIIEMCHWIYNKVSDVKNIINRLAEYAITDIQIDDTHTTLNVEEQETLIRTLESLNLKSKLVEIAKYYFATGNAFISVEIKFKKHFKCKTKGCNTTYPATVNNFNFDKKTIKFLSTCPSCKKYGPVEDFDIQKRRPEDIRLKIWDWHDIDFTYNPISDEYFYYHKLPRSFVEKLIKGGTPDSALLLSTPSDVIREIFTNRKSNNFSSYKGKMVAFLPNKIKHLKNPSTMLSVMEGWGEPVTVGVIQDAFFMLLLRQAQSVLLTDYIVPIRIVSPDPKMAEAIDISIFASTFDKAYNDFTKDPMQIMKFPFPVQYQTLTGEAKSLFLSNELDYTRQSIRRGTGLPAELLDGGTENYSAGSISLRMLENYFANFNNNVIIELINNFIIPNICIILDIPPFRTNMAKLKVIDDVQQKQSFLELYDRNLIPDTEIWERYNIEKPSQKELLSSVENKAIRDGKYQKILANYQAEVQSIMAERELASQFKMQDMQSKNDVVQNAKQTDPDSDPNAMGDNLEGNEKATMTPKGGALPPPEELGDYAMAQLKSPEELNNFMDQLGEQLKTQMPGNETYLERVKKYIGDNQNIKNIHQNAKDKTQKMQSEQQKKTTSNSGVDMRPIPEQKPQRRTSQV